ncbi:hypothetical protein BRC93_03080 [Halobacteriales archaeon QS_5_70_15]|nr:MAG: hypothetical protein BRC93_03080 [Halobacteriales archaeon QS_5_70_15]
MSDGGPDPGCQRETDGGTVAATGGGSDVHADTAVGSGRERSDRLSMLGAVRTVARREYRVAARNRREVGLSALFALFAVGVVGFAAARPDARHDVIVASLVELGGYLVPLVALVVGYDAVVGPEESGTLDTLLALPVARGTVLVGTFLAVCVLVSSLASERTRALGVWVWFVLLHDLLAIGAVAALRPPGPAAAASGAGFSTPVLVAALAAWIALPVAAAARAMARRRI